MQHNNPKEMRESTLFIESTIEPKIDHCCHAHYIFSAELTYYHHCVRDQLLNVRTWWVFPLRWNPRGAGTTLWHFKNATRPSSLQTNIYIGTKRVARWRSVLVAFTLAVTQYLAGRMIRCRVRSWGAAGLLNYCRYSHSQYFYCFNGYLKYMAKGIISV